MWIATARTGTPLASRSSFRRGTAGAVFSAATGAENSALKGRCCGATPLRQGKHGSAILAQPLHKRIGSIPTGSCSIQ